MIETIPLDRITASRTNPRKHFSPEALTELAKSIAAVGVLQPIVVRPGFRGRGSYEIVAGERRFRAAELAGLAEIPATVRDLSDMQVLEIQIEENLHRADLHPLEEAESYRALHETHGQTVDEIAARLGKSKSYVYDRMKLCALIPEAKEHFLADRILAGHAVILARLKPADQERAFEVKSWGATRGNSAVLEQEDVLFDPLEPEDSEPQVTVKPRSVAELQAWVDRHVRLEPEETDPIVFPETAAALEEAAQEDAKVLPITYEHQVVPEARGAKTFGPKSWKRADGKHGSKTCEHAEPGMVVVGAHRGEVFDICRRKEKCQVHWGKEMREKAKRAKQGPKDPDAGKDRYKIEQEKREAEQAKERAEQERWIKAVPAIAAAFAERIASIPADSESRIAATVLDYAMPGGERRNMVKLLPLDASADNVVRRAAFALLIQEMYHYDAARSFPKRAREFDIDVRAIVDQVAPKPKVKKAKKAPATPKIEKGKSPKRPARGKAKA